MIHCKYTKISRETPVLQLMIQYRLHIKYALSLCSSIIWKNKKEIDRIIKESMINMFNDNFHSIMMPIVSRFQNYVDIRLAISIS